MKKALRSLHISAAALFLLAIVLALSACAASSDATQNQPLHLNREAVSHPVITNMLPHHEEFSTEGADAGAPSPKDPSLTSPQDGRKVILNAQITMETLTYDETISTLRQAVQTAGGYISASSSNEATYYRNRNATLVLRVPAEKYNDFLNTVAESGNILSRDEYSDDITAQYVDVEARLTSLRAQETRLLELLAEAQNVEDLITIQNSLSDVQYQIEHYTAQQRSFDDLISYSTITIHITEVEEVTEAQPTGYGSRLLSALQQGWHSAVAGIKNLGIAIALSLPTLLLLALTAIIITFTLRRFLRKRKLKKANISASHSKELSASPEAAPK